jgi:hypothetical protein
MVCTRRSRGNSFWGRGNWRKFRKFEDYRPPGSRAITSSPLERGRGDGNSRQFSGVAASALLRANLSGPRLPSHDSAPFPSAALNQPGTQHRISSYLRGFSARQAAGDPAPGRLATSHLWAVLTYIYSYQLAICRTARAPDGAARSEPASRRFSALLRAKSWPISPADRQNTCKHEERRQVARAPERRR